MSQHTPGPWDYVPGNEHHGPYVTSDFGSTICDCYVMSEPSPVWGGARKPVSFLHEMAEPNARLIAAAPEMLEALHGMLSEWDKFTRYGSEIAKSANERINFARAVVNKAEGRP